MYLFNDKINVYWRRQSILPQKRKYFFNKSKGCLSERAQFLEKTKIIRFNNTAQLNKLIAHSADKALMDKCP